MIHTEKATDGWDLPHRFYPQMVYAPTQCMCGRPFMDQLHRAIAEYASTPAAIVTEKGI